MSTDKIQLVGMMFYGHHGVDPMEQELGQRFIVDVDVHLSLQRAGLSDDVRDTINYARIYRLVKNVVEGPSRKLLENLAETIAQGLLTGYDVDAVSVKVKKPEVPMKGSILDYASVEIFRRSGEA